MLNSTKTKIIIYWRQDKLKFENPIEIRCRFKLLLHSTHTHSINSSCCLGCKYVRHSFSIVCDLCLFVYNYALDLVLSSFLDLIPQTMKYYLNIKYIDSACCCCSCHKLTTFQSGLNFMKRGCVYISIINTQLHVLVTMKSAAAIWKQILI